MTEVDTIIYNLFKNDSIRLNGETTAKDVKQQGSLNHFGLTLAAEKHFKAKFNFMELQEFGNAGVMCNDTAVKLKGTNY